MGQTGAGKTTVVDALCNYLFDIGYFDKFRYKLVDEKELVEQRTKDNEKNLSDKEKAENAQ